MTLAEANRIYQATLEARRRLHTETEGLGSFLEEQDAADRDLADAEEALITAWLSS